MLNHRRMTTIWFYFLFFMALGSTAQDHAAQDDEVVARHSVTLFALSSVDLSSDTVHLVATSKGDGEEVSIEAINEGPHLLELSASTDWTLSCRSAKFWCSKIELSSDEVGSSSILSIFPAAVMSGMVRSTSLDAPEKVLVQGWLSIEGLSDSVASWVEEVEVGEGGKFKVQCPEGKIDLRISARGRAPAYLWGLQASGSFSLQPIELPQGSSIAGFAWDGVEDLPAAKAAVNIFPAGIEPDLFADKKSARLATKTATSNRGFFQIDGLRQGLYRLEVSAEGRATQIVEQLEVREESETFLDGQIVLMEPHSLDIYLSPPVPNPDERWTVRLAGTARSVVNKTEIKIQADSTGFASAGDLSPQNYLIQILHPNDSEIFTEEKYIDSNELLEIDLPVVNVRGKIELNGEPLGATLLIEAGFRDRSRLVSDADSGEFSGIVRRPDWKLLIIRILAEDPKLKRRIIVEEPEIEDGVVQLDLELVGIDLVGEVVDEKGNSVHGATVRASQGSSSSTTQTASDGSFTFHALDAAAHDLQAEHPRGSSEIFPIELHEDVSPPSIRLVVLDKNEVQAVLSTPGGAPVRGARITVFSAGSAPTYTSTESDLEGRFQFELTPKTSRVLLQVLAPSQVIWSGCLTVDSRPEDGPMRVTLPAAPGGRLEIQTRQSAEPSGPPDTSSRWVLLTSDGGFLGYNEAYNWSLMTGNDSTSELMPGDWWISGLAAGREYAALRSGEARWKLASKLCLTGSPPNLEWHYLPEGGQVTVLVENPGQS